MKKLFIFIPLLALLYGCASNPPKEVFPFRMPDPSASADVLAKRTEQFHQVISGCDIAGTWIYPKNFDYEFSPEEVVAMIKDFGFNRIYCRITSEDELDSYFLDLLVAADDAGIKAEIMLDFFSFYSRKGVNTVWSHLLPESPDIPTMVKKLISKFKWNLSYATLDGITIVVNPHRFTKKNLDYPKGVHFVWSESTYGVGLDNDEIMKFSLEIIRDLPEFPEGLQLSIAVPDFYDTLVEEGKLSCGTLADFIKVRNDNPRAIVLCYGNIASELKENTEDEMAIKEVIPEKIPLLVQLANHTSVRSGKLRRRDWNDMIKTLSYLRKNAETYPIFGGIIFGPFGLLKTLQAEP